MNADSNSISPYEEAWRWIESHRGSLSARSLAKLLLSFWNPNLVFSIRMCFDDLDDDDATRLAERLVDHYANFGEDRELSDLGYKVQAVYPELSRRTR